MGGFECIPLKGSGASRSGKIDLFFCRFWQQANSYRAPLSGSMFHKFIQELTGALPDECFQDRICLKNMRQARGPPHVLKVSGQRETQLLFGSLLAPFVRIHLEIVHDINDSAAPVGVSIGQRFGARVFHFPGERHNPVFHFDFDLILVA